jgi:hypothetical protein
MKPFHPMSGAVWSTPPELPQLRNPPPPQKGVTEFVAQLEDKISNYLDYCNKGYCVRDNKVLAGFREELAVAICIGKADPSSEIYKRTAEKWKAVLRFALPAATDRPQVKSSPYHPVCQLDDTWLNNSKSGLKI